MKIIQLGGAFHQSFFIEELVKAGYFVECLDNVSENPGHLYSYKSHQISITDLKEIQNLIYKKDYILSSFGSDIAELTRLNLTDKNNIQINLYKKFTARLFLNSIFSNQINTNIWMADKNIAKSSKKLVVKPNISSGSKGVKVISPNQEISEAITIAKKISIDNQAVVEEYIINDGKKYYCEGIMLNGEIIFVIGYSTSSEDNLIWDGSNQIRSYNISKSTSLSFEYIALNLEESIFKMSKTIKQKSFVYNIDFFINKEHIKIIEFALRPGGNFLPMVLEHTYKINYSLTYLSILKGSPMINYRNTPILNISDEKAIKISIFDSKDKKNLFPEFNNSCLTLTTKQVNSKISNSKMLKIYGI